MISAWGLDWTSDAVLALDNPWWTDELLAPEGTYLSFHALAPLAGIVLTPLVQLAGAALTVNILKLVLPIAAALSASLLGREAGLPRPAAWLTGALFGFSTIVVWRTTFHLNFGFGLALLPLAPYFAMRYSRTSSRADAALAGAAVGLLVLTDLTMALFGALTVAALVVLAAIGERTLRRWAAGAGVMFAAAVIVGAPQLAMVARAASNDGYDPNDEALAASWTGASTNLFTMLSPGNVREAVPGTLEDLAYRHPWGEATPAYGWGALALALACVILLPLARPPSPARLLFLVWAGVVLAAGTVLALGPELTFTDRAWLPLEESRYGQRLSLVMPYTWLTHLPLFGDVRIPARFTMMGMLGLALLGGAGATLLWRAGRAGRVLLSVILAFAVLESGFPDGGADQRWVPLQRDSLYAPVRADERDSVVVDIPLGFIGATAGAGETASHLESMLRATEHEHPIAEAYVTRLTQSQVDALVARPFYSSVLALQRKPPGEVAPPRVDIAAAASDMRATDVGWAVVWPGAERRVMAFLERLGFVRVREDAGIVLMRRR
jgi:hypothetical protein